MGLITLFEYSSPQHRPLQVKWSCPQHGEIQGSHGVFRLQGQHEWLALYGHHRGCSPSLGLNSYFTGTEEQDGWDKVLQLGSEAMKSGDCNQTSPARQGSSAPSSVTGKGVGKRQTLITQ